MNQKSSLRVALVAFNLFLLFTLIGSVVVVTSARNKRASAGSARKSRGGHASKSARAARRGRGHLSKKELRADRRRAERDQAAYLAKLEKRSGHKLSKKERAAEMRRFESKHRRELEEARRRAEAARQAAIARQRAIDEGMRNEVEANIAKDNTTGEDLEVRNAAVAALGHHAGTVVVMDPKTGRVYTVVNQEWALRRGFKPCSTIKLVTGVAGLCEKVIQPLETVSDGAKYRIDLTDALAYSNNSYFQSVGGQVGFDKMVSYARELGLGEKTGVNYVNESPGRVPLFKSGYAVNHMSSHGDDFEVTAIQLAALVAAMSNGGKLLVPHVPRTVEENSAFKTELRRRINVDNEAWKRMVPGMIGAVNYGSGKKAYRPEQTVAGKTGTCIGQGAWLGLFTSYAPVVNPRLAVVVITRGTDAHQHLPAAIAGNIYRALSTRFGTQINFQVAEGPDEETPVNKHNKKAAALDEEAAETKAAEAEENGDEAANPAAPAPNANTKADTGTEPANKVKPTVMPVDNKAKGENKTKAPAKPAPNDPNDGRPRRIQPDQK
jgi:membrane peptidoglycan carboxypeptidase